MNLLTQWIRSFLPELPVSDRQLAEDLTLRGIAVEGEFPLATGGTRFEMDITTNRVDAMNHYGVAREAATIYNRPLLKPEGAEGRDIPHTVDGPIYPVRIEAKDLCGRFTTRIVRNVTIARSTGRIAEYFDALGQKPISNAVDITNYAWLAMGHPTHVFDLDTLEGSIIVRRANAGEKLRLLDGSEKVLTINDLVVADEKKALGLAGIMGGWDSRVTESTKNILVEAAWFDPATIRASSRRHGLHTDASHRFERGADFEAARTANNLVTRLLVEQCGGEVVGTMADEIVPQMFAKTANREPIQLRVSEVKRHLGETLDGTPIDGNLVRQYLTSLGCRFADVLDLETGEVDPSAFAVTLPSWRLDLEREIDLLEEICRVYGYNRFANTLPAFSGEVTVMPHIAAERTLRNKLLALGYTETLFPTFSSAADAVLFTTAPAVPLGNPLNEEVGFLRPSLLPGMAAMIENNLRRDVPTLRLFEMGNIFTGSTVTVHESTSLSLGLTGGANASAIHSADDALFFEAKGTLNALLAPFTGTLTYDTESLPSWIEPGRGTRAMLNGTPIATFGELTTAELTRRKLRQPVVLAELNAQQLFSTPLRSPIMRELSRFQAVSRDFSFLFPDSVQWSAIHTAITTLNIAELTSITPEEIFRDPKGKAVATGSYSLLTRVVFQSPDRTLTDDDLTTWSTAITSALITLNGTQRA